MNRDDIRDCVFPDETLDYTHEQNELASQITYQVAEYILEKDKEINLCFDGRPFSSPAQLQPMIDLAAASMTPAKIVKCVAPDEVVLERLHLDNQDPQLAAAGRNREKYFRIKRVFQDPPFDFLTINTSEDPNVIEEKLLAYIDSENTGIFPL